jgi:hypothetical protein
MNECMEGIVNERAARMSDIFNIYFLEIGWCSQAVKGLRALSGPSLSPQEEGS